MDQPGATPTYQLLRGRGNPSSGKGLIIAIVTVIAIVIIVVLFGAASARRYETYLSGMWVGDPAFLKRAKLRDMQLFLAPCEDRCRQGYIIMTDLSGNFISNQALEFRERSPVKRWWTALGSVFRSQKDAYSASCVEIDYDGAESEPPMPEQMKMTLSILDGTLTLYDDEKVYAFFEKDLVASAAAIEAYTA